MNSIRPTKLAWVSVAACLSLLFGGCATTSDPGSGAAQGAVLGALLGGAAGAIIGHQSGEAGEGAAIGAGAGAVIGGLAGHSAAKSRQDDERSTRQASNTSGERRDFWEPERDFYP